LAYAQLARKYGGKVVRGTAAGLVKDGSRIRGIQTSDGEEVLGDQIVLAMGCWTEKAGEWLGVPMPILPMKGEVVRLEYDGPPVNVSASGVHIPPMTFYSIGPRGDGEYIINGITKKSYIYDNALTDEARKVLMDFTVKLLPTMAEARFVGHVAGTRGVSSDGLPLMGPVSGWEGVYICQGNPGIMCSYYWGQITRDVVLGRDLDFSLEPFRPERFASGESVRGKFGLNVFPTD
jgi:glycine oxidase